MIRVAARERYASHACAWVQGYSAENRRSPPKLTTSDIIAVDAQADGKLVIFYRTKDGSPPQ